MAAAKDKVHAFPRSLLTPLCDNTRCMLAVALHMNASGSDEHALARFSSLDDLLAFANVLARVGVGSTAKLESALFTCLAHLSVLMKLFRTCAWPHDRCPTSGSTWPRCWERLVPLLEAQVMDQTVRPVLQELTEDPDTDVRFYASQALVRRCYSAGAVQNAADPCY